MSYMSIDLTKENNNEEKKTSPKLLSRDNIKSYLYVLAVIFGIISIFYFIALVFGISIAPHLGGPQGGPPSRGNGGSPRGNRPPQKWNHLPPKGMNQGGEL